MRSLKECVATAMGNVATPANTIGMGNPSDASGDALALSTKSLSYRLKKKKKKKNKKIKEVSKSEEE